MKKEFRSMKKQDGNMLIGLLIIALLIGAVMTFMKSGDSNPSSVASSAAVVMSGSIENDSTSIKTAFDTLVGNNYAASTITFVPNTASASNMLDPSTGIQVPRVNSSLVVNTTFPNGAYIYKPSGFKGNAIGTAADDQVIVLAGVKDSICTQINSYYGVGTAAPISGLASTAFTTGAVAAAPTSSNVADLSAVAGMVGWSFGCVTTTGGADNNVYFRVMKAN